jgi:hypothetical protein
VTGPLPKLAFFAPDVVGANMTSTAQVPAGARLAGHPLVPMWNCNASGPVSWGVNARGIPAVLVSENTKAGLCEPMLTVPNA